MSFQSLTGNVSSQQRFLVSYDINPKKIPNDEGKSTKWANMRRIEEKVNGVMRSAGMHNFQGSLWISNSEPREGFAIRLGSLLADANITQRLRSLVIVPIDRDPTDILKVLNNIHVDENFISDIPVISDSEKDD